LVSVYNVICLHHHAPVRTVGQGEGITPLMYCCHARGSLDCAQALLRGGAKVDQKLVSAPAFVVGAASPLLRLATGCIMQVCVCARGCVVVRSLSRSPLGERTWRRFCELV
jgi:hypothetical protein